MTLLNIDELKKYSLKCLWLYRPIAFVSTYAVWVLAIRLLTLTFITYFTISPSTHFQDISDAFSSNEVSLMGLSAFLFVGLLFWLTPLTTTTLEDIITRERIEKSFLPGFFQGACLAGGIILTFVLIGVYRYLGYYIQFDEAPLELANTLLRMVTLGALAYCEEFIFRFKLPHYFKGMLPDIATANLIAVLYCGIKMLQFDLGLMHLITLYLVSIALFYRTRFESKSPRPNFQKGAGFWAAILIILNPLLSLPIFGNDFSGVLLIKYQPTLEALSTFDKSSNLTRLLTGGAGGPISSFVLQLLLILDIGRSILKQKKTRIQSKSSS